MHQPLLTESREEERRGDGRGGEGRGRDSSAGFAGVTVTLILSFLHVCVSVCVNDEEARNVIYYLHHSLLAEMCLFETNPVPERVGAGVFVLLLCEQVVLVRLSNRQEGAKDFLPQLLFASFRSSLPNGVVYRKYIQRASACQPEFFRLSSCLYRQWEDKGTIRSQQNSQNVTASPKAKSVFSINELPAKLWWCQTSPSIWL